MNAPESITCPRCARTSYNPNDIRERYCGACHQWHDQMPATLVGFAERLAEECGVVLDEWQRYWLRALASGKNVSLIVSTLARRSLVQEALRNTIRRTERAGFVRARWDNHYVIIDEVHTWFDASWWAKKHGRGVDELDVPAPEHDPSPCGWHRRDGYRLGGPADDRLPDRLARWPW